MFQFWNREELVSDTYSVQLILPVKIHLSSINSHLESYDTMEGAFPTWPCCVRQRRCHPWCRTAGRVCDLPVRKQDVCQRPHISHILVLPLVARPTMSFFQEAHSTVSLFQLTKWDSPNFLNPRGGALTSFSLVATFQEEGTRISTS